MSLLHFWCLIELICVQVRKMAAEFNAKEIALNVLINNAGILPITTGVMPLCVASRLSRIEY